MTAVRKLLQELSKDAGIKPIGENPLSVLCEMVPLRPIRSDNEHKKALGFLRLLNTKVEQMANSPTEQGCVDYLKILGGLVEEYEIEKFGKGKVTGAEMLQFLIEQHGLTQSDFTKEIGAQSVVSEILSGKRELTRKHIERLAVRFHISVAVFFGG